MLYSKTIDEKLIEIELNSTRTHRSGGALNSTRSSTNSNSFRFSTYLQNPNLSYADILAHANKNDNKNKSDTNLNLDNNNNNNFNENNLLTNRSLLLTNRTNKSVRFDDEQNEQNQLQITRNSNIDQNEIDVVNEKNKMDYLQNQAVNKRYKTLTDFFSNDMKSTASDTNISPFSLSLPLTPRSLDGLTHIDLSKNPNLDDSSFISKEMSKSLESIYKEYNRTFIQE